ncbi:hypothetical protein [Moraxella marmotae]|uniref:hypothetical protein n=1 Tax=Moraxella marmotae TaxID=3344520 RepID=UPI0035F33E52
MNPVFVKFPSWTFFCLNCLYAPVFYFLQTGALGSAYQACLRIIEKGVFYDSLATYIFCFGLFIGLNLLFLCVVYVFNKNMAWNIIKNNKIVLIALLIFSHMILCHRLYFDVKRDFEKECGQFLSVNEDNIK